MTAANRLPHETMSVRRSSCMLGTKALGTDGKGGVQNMFRKDLLIDIIASVSQGEEYHRD